MGEVWLILDGSMISVERPPPLFFSLSLSLSEYIISSCHRWLSSTLRYRKILALSIGKILMDLKFSFLNSMTCVIILSAGLSI